MEDYFRRKVAGLHLEYPRIVDVHLILDIEKYRHSAEVILRCSNHITIKASAETDDMYASLDQVVDRIARKMRKYHTRLMCNGLLRRHSVRTGTSELRGPNRVAPF
jgi:putative sigma-54 modulation protein